MGCVFPIVAAPILAYAGLNDNYEDAHHFINIIYNLRSIYFKLLYMNPYTYFL